MEKFAKLFTEIGKLWAKYGGSYLMGIRNTLILALTATAIGCVIGFLCGVLNTIPCAPGDSPVKKFFLKLIRAIVRIYVEVFRGTPMVLQAVFLYYGLPYFTNGAQRFDNIWAAAILVVSINTGAYMAEIVRGGIISIDKGQFEAGRSLGFNYVQTMAYIVVPQVIKNVLPALANEFIVLLKETSVAGYVAVTDLTKGGDIIRGRTFSAFMPLIVVALIYLVMVMFFTWLVGKLERRLRSSDH